VPTLSGVVMRGAVFFSMFMLTFAFKSPQDLLKLEGLRYVP